MPEPTTDASPEPVGTTTGELDASRLAAELREARAELDAARAELDRRAEALEALGDRLVPIEVARAEGAAGERDRRLAAEHELRVLRATKLYRLLLRPRAVIYRYRERRETGS